MPSSTRSHFTLSLCIITLLLNFAVVTAVKPKKSNQPSQEDTAATSDENQLGRLKGVLDQMFLEIQALTAEIESAPDPSLTAGSKVRRGILYWHFEQLHRMVHNYQRILDQGGTLPSDAFPHTYSFEWDPDTGRIHTRLPSAVVQAFIDHGMPLNTIPHGIQPPESVTQSSSSSCNAARTPPSFFARATHSVCLPQDHPDILAGWELVHNRRIIQGLIEQEIPELEAELNDESATTSQSRLTRKQLDTLQGKNRRLRMLKWHLEALRIEIQSQSRTLGQGVPLTPLTMIPRSYDIQLRESGSPLRYVEIPSNVAHRFHELIGYDPDTTPSSSSSSSDHGGDQISTANNSNPEEGLADEDTEECTCTLHDEIATVVSHFHPRSSVSSSSNRAGMTPKTLAEAAIASITSSMTRTSVESQSSNQVPQTTSEEPQVDTTISSSGPADAEMPPTETSGTGNTPDDNQERYEPGANSLTSRESRLLQLALAEDPGSVASMMVEYLQSGEEESETFQNMMSRADDNDSDGWFLIAQREIIMTRIQDEIDNLRDILSSATVQEEIDARTTRITRLTSHLEQMRREIRHFRRILEEGQSLPRAILDDIRPYDTQLSTGNWHPGVQLPVVLQTTVSCGTLSSRSSSPSASSGAQTTPERPTIPEEQTLTGDVANFFEALPTTPPRLPRFGNVRP